MSCYMASARELTILAAYAVRNCRETLRADVQRIYDRPGGPGEERAMRGAFASLAAANKASVRHHYGRRVDESDFGEALDPKALAETLPTAVLIKACHHYAYQACEAPTWPASPAKRMIDAIEAHAIRHMPGYGEAPWGL